MVVYVVVVVVVSVLVVILVAYERKHMTTITLMAQMTCLSEIYLKEESSK